MHNVQSSVGATALRTVVLQQASVEWKLLLDEVPPPICRVALHGVKLLYIEVHGIAAAPLPTLPIRNRPLNFRAWFAGGSGRARRGLGQLRR